jgi:tetratricopeptide (TPR) repeat protein
VLIPDLAEPRGDCLKGVEHGGVEVCRTRAPVASDDNVQRLRVIERRFVRAFKEAEAVLRQAAARHPDSVVVLNNLAQTLSDQGHHDEALALSERAVALGGPYAAAARDTRELILQCMGRKN